MGSSMSKTQRYAEHQEPFSSALPENEELPVQCVDDPLPENAVEVYGNEEFPLRNQLTLPVQCVDDPLPENAVEVYGNEEFPLRNQLTCEEPTQDDGGK